MGYFVKSTFHMGISQGNMRHGIFSDMRQCHFLNSTCDMGTPHEGPPCRPWGNGRRVLEGAGGIKRRRVRVRGRGSMEGRRVRVRGRGGMEGRRVRVRGRGSMEGRRVRVRGRGGMERWRVRVRGRGGMER